MIALLAHSALIVQQRLTEGKYRCLVFAAAWLQQCQLLQIPDTDFTAAAQNTVNRLMRQIILRTQLCATYSRKRRVNSGNSSAGSVRPAA
mgnify:CR=1 FL=1